VAKCPKCGAEVAENESFCRSCGVRLSQPETVPGTSEDAVKAVITQRIDGVRRKDAEAILKVVDKERYTKFDDWPPFERQGPEALESEAEAFKVLKEYGYEIVNWKVDVFGDMSLASFIINYRGVIRELSFNIKSRVTAFLVNEGGEWKLLHEHWSRFPEQQRQREQWQGQRRRRQFPF
jgi:ketosteroid isomerase-like protein